MIVVKRTNLKKLTLWSSVILDQIVVAQLLTNPLEPRVILPCLQELATGPYPVLCGKKGPL